MPAVAKIVLIVCLVVLAFVIVAVAAAIIASKKKPKNPFGNDYNNNSWTQPPPPPPPQYGAPPPSYRAETLEDMKKRREEQEKELERLKRLAEQKRLAGMKSQPPVPVKYSVQEADDEDEDDDYDDDDEDEPVSGASKAPVFIKGYYSGKLKKSEEEEYHESIKQYAERLAADQKPAVQQDVEQAYAAAAAAAENFYSPYVAGSIETGHIVSVSPPGEDGLCRVVFTVQTFTGSIESEAAVAPEGKYTVGSAHFVTLSGDGKCTVI